MASGRQVFASEIRYIIGLFLVPVPSPCNISENTGMEDVGGDLTNTMKYWLFIIACNIVTGLYAQETDTIRNLHLFKPDRFDTIVKLENIDTVRVQFIRDSILAREIFIRDSLLAREQFVRDSLLRRKKILDSLNILKPQLERLLD